MIFYILCSIEIYIGTRTYHTYHVLLTYHNIKYNFYNKLIKCVIFYVYALTIHHNYQNSEQLER